MSIINDVTCALFGHRTEIEAYADNAFTTTIRCSRCGDSIHYHWMLDEEFIRAHKLDKRKET